MAPSKSKKKVPFEDEIAPSRPVGVIVISKIDELPSSSTWIGTSFIRALCEDVTSTWQSKCFVDEKSLKCFFSCAVAVEDESCCSINGSGKVTFPRA